ncbi:hypothetical protein CXP39_01430 [Mesoplasma syrphidae]|uniref:Uncharacterized protein n=1 Tax=Mesoplasma syrphidae TaxID=225999 RepID=A0A2K9BJH7_9MOLU|nr:hypothetical protein [Mesoplasma syrphidae]AUF83461.1 hypothetical protein CXP39_01430 [Mesoplasma syrphidae]
MITKLKENFYIEKNDNFFCIKDFKNNIVKICSNYLDAIIELESIYNKSITNNDYNLEEKKQNYLKDNNTISDKKFDKIADLINLKISNLEHILKTEIAHSNLKTKKPGDLNTENNKIINYVSSEDEKSSKYIESLRKLQNSLRESKYFTDNEDDSLFKKLSEDDSYTLENVKKKIVDQLEWEIDDVKKQCKELTLENSICDSKINDLHNNLESVILNLNKIKENCLEKVSRDELFDREQKIIDSFQIALNKEMKSFDSDISIIEQTIQSLKESNNQLVQKDVFFSCQEKLKEEINDLVDRNNQESVELLNMLRTEIFKNKKATDELTESVNSLISYSDLEKLKDEIFNKIQNLEATAKRTDFKSEIEDMKNVVAQISEEIKSNNSATTDFVSLDKVNNIKLEMFKAFQDELKLTKSNYEKKLMENNKKYKKDFDSLKLEFVESLDLLLALNGKVNDLATEEKLKEIKQGVKVNLGSQ